MISLNVVVWCGCVVIFSGVGGVVVGLVGASDGGWMVSEGVRCELDAWDV